MLRLLHLAAREPDPDIWTGGFIRALEGIGELRIVPFASQLSEGEKLRLAREADVALTCWGSEPLPTALTGAPGGLGYLCTITGSLRAWIPEALVESGLPVTNWGDTIAKPLAEATLTLMLATAKRLLARVERLRREGWRADSLPLGGTLLGADLGLYGCGAIGRRLVELLRPFEARIRIYDPYLAEPPPGCETVEDLETLFRKSLMVVVTASLTEETRGSVTAGLLRLLPEGGAIVNTARGAIVDQEALFAELASGRLSAGLDVLEPDGLPAGHPAFGWDNCILTGHGLGRMESGEGERSARLPAAARALCLENIARYASGRPLLHRVAIDAYRRMT